MNVSTSAIARTVGLIRHRGQRRLSRLLPGLVASFLLGLAGERADALPAVQAHGLSALTIAIVLGILVANVLPRRFDTAFSIVTQDGILLGKQYLLRLGIVLYGLRLTLQDVAHIGVSGVVIDACIIGSTFGLACWLGARLGLERKTAMLIGVGSSICGAAAIMAAEPVVRARAEEVTIAVATVVVFGTVAIFLYPALFDLNLHWRIFPTDAKAFGIYAGSTIHEVAQVLAAARSVSADAANTAVITKMVRVMMLAPFLMALSGWLARRARLCRHAKMSENMSGDSIDCPAADKISVPWFAVGFIAVVIVSSIHVIPATVVHAFNIFDTLILATAMAALGLSTRLSMIRRAGVRPLALATVLAGWLVVGGAFLNRLIPPLLQQ